MVKNYSLLFAAIFLFSFSLHFSLAYGEYKLLANSTDEQKAISCLQESSQILNELNNSGFSIARVGDLVTQAQDVKKAQDYSKLRGGKVDYTRVTTICDQILDLYNLALKSEDSLTSLEKFYNDTYDKNINFSEVDSLIIQIKSEIESERYENVQSLIDQTYERISTIKSENTQLTLFYKSTSSRFISFAYTNRYFLSTLLALVVIVWVFFRKSIKSYFIKRELNSLNVRKENLKKLIKKTQEDYFQKGTLAETTYEVRVKNFGEMVRDIDRQIPLLNEELLKVSRNNELAKQLKSEKRTGKSKT